MLKVSKIGVSYLINSITDLFSSDKGEEISIEKKCEKLRVLRKTLESYGGLLAKVSQMLSYGITDENVFDDLKPFSRDKTHKFMLHFIKKENVPYTVIPKIYKSGSIGQVYKGSYKDKKIAIKIRYLGLEEQTDEDLKVINLISKFLFNSKNIVESLNVIKNKIEEEIDFNHELDNHKKIYDLWKEDKSISIPKVYQKLSNKMCLVSDFVDGITFFEFLKIANQEEKNKIGYDLVKFSFTNIYLHKLLYSDIHAGNIIITKENGSYKLNIIDFGCISFISDKTYKYLKKIHKNVKLKNKKKFIKYMKKIGLFIENTSDESIEYGWKIFQENNRPWCEEKKFTFTNEWLLKTEHKEWGLLQQWGLPKELVYFNKIPYGLFHILVQLNCSNNFYKIFNDLINISIEDDE